MVHYKLSYFNSRGRAEVSRLILAAAGVDYEDVRLGGEQWPEFKPKTPFGSMPVLTIDGKTMLAESGAIARYLAKAHGLAGKNALEEAKADMISEAFHDLAMALMKVVFEKDAAKKEELRNAFRSETLPKFTCNMEKLMKCNHEGKAFMVGDGLTYADLVAYNLISLIMSKHASALDDAPLLKAHAERIGNLPKVKAWVEKRPQTEM